MASFAATISALFSKIIAFFISILIALFPNSTVELQQQRDNDLSQWAPIIEEAIQTKDIEATMDFMSEAVKQDVENLSFKIQTLYSLIDGNVIDIVWEPSQSSDYPGFMSDGNDLILLTDSGNRYLIRMAWTTIYLECPDRTKCVDFFLLGTNPKDESVYSHTYPMMQIGSNSDKATIENDWNRAVEQALREKNISVLENELCVFIKDSTDSLHNRLQQLYDNMKGDIIDVDWYPSTTWVVDDAIQRTYHLYIWTTEDFYVISIDYQQENSKDPDYVGINGLYLSHPTPQKNEKLFYLASDNSVEQQNVKDWLSE